MELKAIPLLALALLASCATPEARLRDGLINAGLSPSLAARMAERMVDWLLLAQLSRIGDLPRATSAVSIQQFLHRVRALGDAQILRVSSSSVALDAIGLGSSVQRRRQKAIGRAA